MPRAEDIPDCPAVPSPSRGDERRFEIELITPMFGGGVVTRENDSSFPIRPTSIRGQLQFWWRATVGSKYETLRELRDAQSEVWGDTERSSRLSVLVEPDKTGMPKPCAVIRPNNKGKDQVFWEPPFQNNALPYALFPFQGKAANREGPKVDPAACIHQARFRLILRVDPAIDFTEQVEPALWAWVNFGGLGSRTRRGCGSLFCKAFAPGDVAALNAAWKKYLPNQEPEREWPTLAECLLLRTSVPPGDAVAVWDWLIGLFRHFRQGEDFGRNPPAPGSGRPGRSFFPEPETIRRVTGRRFARHARQPHIPDNAFSRAELGLPIVFQFQDKREGEPQDTVLYPDPDADGNKRERMASPLILKPLALQNGKAIPLILRLRTPALTGVDLRDGNTSLPLPAPTLIRHPSLATYPRSPLVGSPAGSALEAFLAFARSEGFTEVTR